jgi:hypothetical protein
LVPHEVTETLLLTTKDFFSVDFSLRHIGQRQGSVPL